MKRIIFIFSLGSSLVAGAQADTSQKRVEGRRNSLAQQQKPYVILISADGFRHDYAEKHGASFLQKTGQENTKAAYMIPSYPTLTFPNHYTLATGLYPSHHGLVDNRFYDRSGREDYSMSKADKVRDPKWYGGTPLWVLAEQQQMLSASFYWVGSEAPVQGLLPTYHYHYNEKISIEKRIDAVVNWLQLPEEKRPHLITFYFPEVDHAGHTYGPDAPKTGAAVRWVDSALQQLTTAVERTGLAVNFIFVADHGMTTIDTEKPVLYPSVDTSKAIVSRGGELMHVYVKKREDIEPLYSRLKKAAAGYSVYLKKDMPRRLQYNGKNDRMNRIGDILLLPHWPRIFASPGAKLKPGVHGFDPYLVPDMRTVFYAWGPAFKKNSRVGAVNNVDVYPVITRLLGLSQTGKIDGSNKLAKKILLKRP